MQLMGWLMADYLTWIIRFLHVMAVGQTLFVLSWATLPWWRTVIGRALMVKSFGWMLYLDWSVIVYHTGYFAHRYAIGFWLLGLVTVGIWSQTFALWGEMWRGHKARKRRRTDAHDSSLANDD
jgi:hypothetical protein